MDNIQIETISEDMLNQLFNGVTPTETSTPASTTKVITDEQNTVQIGETFLENVDLDELEKQSAAATPAPEGEKKVEEKKEEGKPEEKKEEEKKTEEGADADKDKAPTDEEVKQINQILKTSVDYLVSKGLMPDFQGRETAEITEEAYADLLVEGVQNKAHELFGELVDSTGDYGKVIIHHIKNGGNPDDIIDLFKEQKQIESININDERGQLSIIEKYYQEEVGWSKAKVDKYIQTLKGADLGLEDEAKEVQGKYDEIYSKQIEDIKKQQEKFEQDKKVAEQQAAKERKEYLQNLSSTIDQAENLTDADRKLIKNSILKFDKKLPNGTPVNDFYMKFYEIQKDPKAYMNLVHYVMDTEGFEKKVGVKQDSTKVQNSWKFIKGNNAVNNKNTGDTPARPANNKAPTLNFSGLIKK